MDSSRRSVSAKNTSYLMRAGKVRENDLHDNDSDLRVKLHATRTELDKTRKQLAIAIEEKLKSENQMSELEAKYCNLLDQARSNLNDLDISNAIE